MTINTVLFQAICLVPSPFLCDSGFSFNKITWVYVVNGETAYIR